MKPIANYTVTECDGITDTEYRNVAENVDPSRRERIFWGDRCAIGQTLSEMQDGSLWTTNVAGRPIECVVGPAQPN